MNEAYKILVVDDEKDYRVSLKRILESKGYIVGEAESAADALNIIDSEYYPLILTDIYMPGIDGLRLLEEVRRRYEDSVKVILVTGYGSIDNAVQAMRKGAFGYFIKSHSPEELLAEVEKAKKIVNLQNQKNMRNKDNETSRFLYQSKNPKMQEILGIIDTIVDSSASVLLLGESGVGKEVLADMLHAKSVRRDMPFVAINCQAFSDNLLEAELFGHEKGAFTGAMGKRIGRFEEANGGTVFLDEIGEMSLNTQIKLLRVLENKRIERIGSNKSIAVDFRLISATNKDLPKAMKAKEFREDLFYRLNTITIEIPPLRERKEDIGGMINFFADYFRSELKKDIKGIESGTMDYLLNYQYPGNVRELKNIIERMVVLSKDGILSMNNPTAQSAPNPELAETELELKNYRDAKKEFEIAYFRTVLKQCGNNITQAASMIGMSRRQLFNKIIEYNLKEFM
ncbi:MAG TPA: sigma-54 dependent transcriptional regulator [Negativicutes bacterium]|nr:sigma-54 dependent transcriptional regulator [Negativicutes bacterium]